MKFYEVSIKQLFKFTIFEFLMFLYKLLIFPPLRKKFLLICGAKIGKKTIIHETSFFNLYRIGFEGLSIGNKCFIGNECMFDLADKIKIKDSVTLAERVLILTHINTGYKDHPLQKHFPKYSKPVIIEKGSFIGAGAIILAGVTIEENCLIAAGSVVIKNVPKNTVVGGNPAKIIKEIK